MAIQKPTNLILTKIGDTVRLEWQDNQLSETLGFKVKRNSVEIATLPQNSVITRNGVLNPISKTQSFSMVSDAQSTGLFNFTVNKNNYSNITNFNIVDSDTPTGSINYQLYQSIITLNAFTFNSISTLNSITCTNSNIYLMFSVDNGSTWKSWDTTNLLWQSVDMNNIDDVSVKANSIGTINSLSSSNLELLRGTNSNLKIAYYILINDNNKYTNNTLTINYKDTTNVSKNIEVTHNISTGNQTSFVDLEAIKGITNTYEVYSFNATEQSETLVGSIVIAPIDVSGGSFITNGYNITFSWSNILCDGYKIYDESNNLITTTATSSYIWTNESQTEQNKTIKVSAYNTGGESNKLSITGMTIPNSPFDLFISQVSGGLELNWTNNSSLNDGFKIQKRIEGSAWVDIGSVDDTTYTDVFDVDTNTLYEYQVCAYNSIGNSGFATWGTYVIDSVILSYSYDEAENQIIYYWDESIGCTGYKLYITENGVTTEYIQEARDYAVAIDREFIQSAYVVSYIEDETLGLFESENSNTVNCKSYPLSNVTDVSYVFDVNASKVTISFKDNSIVEDGFRVWYKIDDNVEQSVDVLSTSSEETGNVYTTDISLTSLKETLSFYIETYNYDYSIKATTDIITPMARPKAVNVGYVLGNAKFGWIDNTNNEQKYRLFYKINNGVEQTLDVISTTTIGSGNIYNAQIPMDIASTVSAYICAVDGNGILSIPSEIVTSSFATYEKEPIPTDFMVKWESLGVAKYSWTCNSAEIYGYKLTYRINEEEPVTIDFPNELNDVGQQYSYTFSLNNHLDTVSAFLEGYTLIDTTPQTEEMSITFIIADTSPLQNFWKEKNDNGYLFTWDIREYVTDYEIHYILDGINHVLKTPNNYFELVSDNAIQNVSIYVFANFSTLQVSEKTNTMTFTITKEVATTKVTVYNATTINKTVDTNISLFRAKFIFANCLLTSNLNLKTSKSYVESKTMEYAVANSFSFKEVIFYNTSIIASNILGIKNSINLITGISTKNYCENINWLYKFQTVSTDKNLKNIFSDNSKIINLDVSSANLNSMAIKNENLILNINKISFLSYETVSTKGFMVGNIIWSFYQVIYGVYTEVHKIRVCCLGDSITAGHPNYWSENEINHMPNTGTGRITSQYEYWLQRRLLGEYEIINNGYGSDTTERMLNRFDKDILSMTPQYCIIQGGTNDINWAMVEKKNDQAYLDAKMETAKQNLIKIVDKCFDNNIIPILGTLIPRTSAQGIYRTALWDYNKWIISYCNSRDGLYYADFYNAGKTNMPPTPLEEPSVAGNLNPLYDGDSLFDTYGNLTRRGYGVHPNDLGYKIMAEAVPLNIFKGLQTGVKLFIDSSCKVEEDSDGSDIYNSIYNITFNNLDRGRTKIITRYIKNIGNAPIIYSLYNQVEEGIDMKFSTDGINYTDVINGKLDNETINTIYIKVVVPRAGVTPTVSTVLSTRSIKIV